SFHRWLYRDRQRDTFQGGIHVLQAVPRDQQNDLLPPLKQPRVPKFFQRRDGRRRSGFRKHAGLRRQEPLSVQNLFIGHGHRKPSAFANGRAGHVSIGRNGHRNRIRNRMRPVGVAVNSTGDVIVNGRRGFGLHTDQPREFVDHTRRLGILERFENSAENYAVAGGHQDDIRRFEFVLLQNFQSDGLFPLDRQGMIRRIPI